MAEGGVVLPEGTVTLLLGDVEGSTRAWEADPKSTQVAVVALNDLVDELVGRFSGVRPVEQGEGDSFVAAFSRAGDGVACALALQRGLVGGPLRVRLGVHSGDVLRRDEGNYAGPTVIRAARLRNLAHGGQTVVSEAARDLAVDVLPDGVSLLDLGVHRLKDLSRPERVFQLCHPDLVGEFPPLRSLDVRPRNLPMPRTAFIGRAAEMAELVRLVLSEPLVTLTGAGGCGKTRLALQVAAEVVDGFADGVWFVDLAAVCEGADVAARAAQCLGVLQSPAMSLSEAVVAHLGGAQALVVMDNCEHVCEASAALIDAVLSACPAVRILATSRQPLGVDGEVVWRVPSLSLPADGDPGTMAGSPRCEAVQLFVDRARRVQPGFLLDEGNQAAVAAICRRLDGIPLAIELASARVRVLTPGQIQAALSERFGLLVGTSRTALPRQRTLEASLDWSYHLLAGAEQAVFRRLGVFPADFDLEAATAVGSAGEVQPWLVLDLLTQLVDKSLVTVIDGGPTARYRLLETVRAYAVDHLRGADDERGAADRHRDHFLAMSETAAPHLEATGARSWFDRLDRDYPNLQAALIWSDKSGHIRELCRMVAALGPVWTFGATGLHVSMVEGLRWVEAAHRASTGHMSEVRARLLWTKTLLNYWGTSDIAAVAAAGQEALRIAEQLHDDRLTGRALVALAFAQEHTAAAQELWQTAIAASRRAGDDFVLVVELVTLAASLLLRDPQEVRDLLAEASIHANSSQNPWSIVLVDFLVGWSTLIEGRPLDAVEVLERTRRQAHQAGFAIALLAAQGALSLAHAGSGAFEQALVGADELVELGRRTGIRRDAFQAQTRALVAVSAGDLDAAVAHAGEALAVSRGVVFQASSLATLTRVEIATGRLDEAAAHLGELEALSESESLSVSAAEAQLLRGSLHYLKGDRQAAMQAAQAALVAAQALPALGLAIDAIELLARLASDQGAYHQAARFHGAAAAIRDQTGYRLHIFPADQGKFEHALGPATWERANQGGRTLRIDGIIDTCAKSDERVDGYPRMGESPPRPSSRS